MTDRRTLPVRRRAARALAIGPALAALAALVVAGPRAPARAGDIGGAGDVLAYPAGASATRFSGAAFDTCEAPSRPTMRAWLESPYRAVGIYLSGDQRACPQKRLSRGWVRDVSSMGWALLPIDVGLQAPCSDNPGLRAMSIDPWVAAGQGGAAAEAAVAAAQRLGIRAGSPVYADIEAYDRRDRACSEAVLAYASGWTRVLHAAGYLAGVYGNLSSAVADLSARHRDAPQASPDVVWSARWNGAATLRGWRGVPEGHWPEHQRVKQYLGDHAETYGGLELHVDSNVLDAPVASVTRAAVLTAPGRTVEVVCRTGGPAGGWVMLADGSFVPRAAIAGDPREAGTCMLPHRVTGEASLRAAPATVAPTAARAPAGALAWLRCQAPGLRRARVAPWARVGGGRWIDGAHLATARGRLPAGVPSCLLASSDGLRAPG